MPEDNGMMAPLFAPLQMLMQGTNMFLSQGQSMVQSFLNMGARNVQDFSQSVQRGQAQVVTGVNQGLASLDGVAKKPLVDIQQVAQGGPFQQGGQPPQQQQPQPAPQQQTTFSPQEVGGAEMDTRPPYGEQYYPLTQDQSDFREGGFTESPRGEDQPAQKKNIETLFL